MKSMIIRMILIFTLVLALQAGANSATLHVPGEYATIQGAIPRAG